MKSKREVLKENIELVLQVYEEKKSLRKTADKLGLLLKSSFCDRTVKLALNECGHAVKKNKPDPTYFLGSGTGKSKMDV